MGFVLTYKILDKYFRFLFRLDNKSKKRLIIRLIETIEVRSGKKHDFKELFGAWEGNEKAEDIISEIKRSRVENREMEDF